MAEHGFESNDNYEYHVRCLLEYPTSGLRCLNVEGQSTRRKTAYANALALSLDYPHVIYYDFTQKHDPVAKVELPDRPDEEGPPQKPVSAFDRAVSEACAYSEAEQTILIIDQLQAADFRDHIRLYKFVESTEWEYSLATLRANPRKFLLFLISEEPLYHSLQKASFRVWTEAGNTQLAYAPEEFGLDSDAGPMMEALAALFSELGVTPTKSEYERILHDILTRVRTEDFLRHSIYGWTEGVDYAALYSAELDLQVREAMTVIEQFIGLDEIQIGSKT
jgi:hypothetical protein